ncbi:hypothetical protein AKJ47_00680 [candidate division MSBL1 archaeon SCGC-AAA261G05]|uniref:Nmd3 N-terminal domain-containing protein n=2 Tax=candidate division MSBL1 TaxID=215777 RepID=A0A133V1T3_9EURY|nr:hypothetical protein AKJ42_00845 [candidate division MSBL1 archaeon SCGC-AAA261C02]KXB04095.1 hypothetical protein AKJ47_00680 [candidate division MSBL1 archaeon SCGC-AAA261G05]
MQKFCYKCGALEEEKGPLIEGLCQDCFTSEHPLIKTPDQVELRVCGRCGAYFLNNKWHDPREKSELSLLRASEELVHSEIKVAQVQPTGVRYVNLEEASGIDVELESESVPQGIKVEIRARGKIHESQESSQTAEGVVRVKVETTTCDVCSRKSAGYYEAILQVRGETPLSRKRLREVYQALESTFLEEQSRNRGEFVSKIEEKHGGLDLYTSSTTLARHLAEALKEKYGAKTDESSKLIGQTSDGRKKYRVSIVARLP